MKKCVKNFALFSHVFTDLLLLFYIFLMPYLADFYLLEPNTTFGDFYFQYIDNRFYIFEIVIISLTVIAILCITGRVGVSILLTSIPMMLLAYAGSIKFAARNELFRLDDLKLTEAAGMAVNFLDFKFSSVQIRVIVVVGLFCLCGILADILCSKFAIPVKKGKVSRQIPVIFRVFMSCICIAAMFLYGHFFMHSTQNAMAVAGNQITNEGYDRFVLYNFLKNEKNIDITTDDIEKSYVYFRGMAGNEKPQAANSGQEPTVIVIMNESWWNTDNIVSSGISFSTDPMEPYHELAQKCSSGYLSSNIFGGGTVSSETEFLTGINTKYLLSDVGIYAQIREHKVPSIVDYFHALGYHTTAIHPYYGYFYSRDKTYSLMGFDKVIFEDSMDFTDIYTRYISDESLASQIIKEYEDDDNIDKKRFIFAVSIANHDRSLNYKMDAVKDYAYPIKVTIENAALSDADYSDFVNSMNGIYLANKAFRQLVDYFEQEKAPVVVVMYGDHIPFFGGDILEAMGLNGSDFETLKRQYSVPVLMWSNFNDDRVDFSGENISYLSQIILEYAGLPETDMTQIVRSEKEMFRADVRRFVEDAQGRQIKTYNDEQLEMVRHINVIDYDILFGNSAYRDDIWMPHGAGKQARQYN